MDQKDHNILTPTLGVKVGNGFYRKERMLRAWCYTAILLSLMSFSAQALVRNDYRICSQMWDALDVAHEQLQSEENRIKEALYAKDCVGKQCTQLAFLAMKISYHKLEVAKKMKLLKRIAGKHPGKPWAEIPAKETAAFWDEKQSEVTMQELIEDFSDGTQLEDPNADKKKFSKTMVSFGQQITLAAKGAQKESEKQISGMSMDLSQKTNDTATSFIASEVRGLLAKQALQTVETRAIVAGLDVLFLAGASWFASGVLMAAPLLTGATLRKEDQFYNQVKCNPKKGLDFTSGWDYCQTFEKDLSKDWGQDANCRKQAFFVHTMKGFVGAPQEGAGAMEHQFYGYLNKIYQNPKSDCNPTPDKSFTNVQSLLVKKVPQQDEIPQVKQYSVPYPNLAVQSSSWIKKKKPVDLSRFNDQKWRGKCEQWSDKDKWTCE